MSAIKSVGLVVASHKRSAVKTAKELAVWLEANGLVPLVHHRAAETLGMQERARYEDELGQEADLIVSLGGDGTFLAAARVGGPAGKPLLGINLGGFGFLAVVPPERMLELVAQVLEGTFKLEERMMLTASVSSGGKEIGRYWGLNDAVVAVRGTLARLLKLETRVEGELVSQFPADGMIVSTPTGSTAYTLAAGGPVLDPRVPAFIIAPICAHALSARSLVTPADEEVSLTVPPVSLDQPVALTVDGQVGCLLRAGDVVHVRRADFSAKLIYFEEIGFYHRLRTKLGWGSSH